MKKGMSDDFVGRAEERSDMEPGGEVFHGNDFGWELESEYLHDHSFRPDNVCEIWELDDTLAAGHGADLFFG